MLIATPANNRNKRGSLMVLLAICALAATAAETVAAHDAGAQSARVRALTYVYMQGADTLGLESVSASDTAVGAVLTLRGSPRVDWSMSRQSKSYGVLTLRAYAPGSVANAAPLQDAQIRLAGDSAYVAVIANGQVRTQVLPSKPGALSLVNTSLVQAALLSAHAKALNQTTVEFFLASGGRTVPGTLSQAGDTIVLTIGTVQSRILMSPDGFPLEVRVPSQNTRMSRATGPVSQPSPVPPIDYGAPANASYTAENVRIPTGRGYELAGTLTRPKVPSSAKTPVVVTISGSGPQERDSRISIVPGYAIFRDIADTLGRRGIATLRYDDRGIGESGGLESARSATSASYADDVRSVVEWLRKRSDIDGARVALLGHSEGGMIAPMVAASDAKIRAIVLMAGPAYTGRRVVMFQNRESIDAAPDLSPSQRDSVWKTVPAQLDELGKTNPWFGFFMTHDPLVTIRQVKQPVLILQGETDHQVTPEQADTLLTALKTSGNRMAVLDKFPAANHLFLNDPSGMFQGYPTLKDKHVRRDVLGTLADWLATALK